MIKVKKVIWCAWLLMTYASWAQSSGDSTDLANIIVEVASPLEKEINTKVEVGSSRPLPIRMSPSILTVISEQEIQQAGARDLTDILKLVPGLDFARDVESTQGIGTRGLWAQEGKILLMIDGQEMNESLYSTLQFGNHYLPENIKKIEVIRGPGSSLYGGYSMFGVINIITKSGHELQGAEFKTSVGTLSDGLSRKLISGRGGFGNQHFDLVVSAYHSESLRSNKTLTDFYGNSYSMRNNSDISNSNLNVGLRYKNLTWRTIVDQYKVYSRDWYGINSRSAYHFSTPAAFSDIKYTWNLNRKLTLTPRITYKLMYPYQTKAPLDSIDEASGLFNYDKQATRVRVNLTASYFINDRVHVLAGVEGFSDKARTRLEDDTFLNGSKKIVYYNYAAFIQSLIKFRILNASIGARYDNNSSFGSAFVPRIGLTKKIGKFHAKLLYAKSFRAPGIENINYSRTGTIVPEISSVYEAEVGMEVGKYSYFSVNIFDIESRDPIIYQVDSAQNEFYDNFASTGTYGWEASWKTRFSKAGFTFNFSYYALNKNAKVDVYLVPQDPHASLGFANHKINLITYWNFHPNIQWNMNATWWGHKYQYAANPDFTGTFVQRYPPSMIINTNVTFRNLWKNRLDACIGVYDVLNQGYFSIMPFNGGMASLPGLPREFVVSVTYKLKRS
ncbi:MAG: TonB-dependent receptor plug domain-containing protein [Cytophagaceae bacterium]|jgi:outer membrane cobalamin receptor|nr:TonB-dependent receptor plug domain-containing protein [Cytophagaceae bacterium]